MIVRETSNTFAMLFALRGSVIIQIWPRLLVVALVASVVVAAPYVWNGPLPGISLGPFSLLGLVLSIFLGFRNNACYDRWWEGRKQWGCLIEQARALAREVPALLPHDAGRDRRILRRIIGFAACLTARLRGRDDVAAAIPWLPENEARRLPGLHNRPAAILAAISAEFAEALRRGELGEMVFVMLESRVETCNVVQTACERIHTTPAPFAYSLLLHRTSWIFCLLSPFGLVGIFGVATPLMSLILAYAFFGLDAVGDELEEPFGVSPNDLPLDAMVRLIEIDVLEAVGEPDPPRPLVPVRYRLQ